MTYLSRAQLSALDCSTVGTSTCQGLWVVGMMDHAAAHYYNPLLLIMYVSSPVNYCRLHTSTTASVQSSPQPSCLKRKPACLWATNTTEWPLLVSVWSSPMGETLISFCFRGTKEICRFPLISQVFPITWLPPSREGETWDVRHVNPDRASFQTAVQATLQKTEPPSSTYSTWAHMMHTFG